MTLQRVFHRIDVVGIGQAIEPKILDHGADDGITWSYVDCHSPILSGRRAGARPRRHRRLALLASHCVAGFGSEPGLVYGLEHRNDQPGPPRHDNQQNRALAMGAQANATKKGLDLSPIDHGYLAMCVQTGSLIFTSGHVSTIKGVVGADVTVDQGYEAARDCAEKILRSVHDHHGSLDGLRVLKLLGAVYSAPDFTDHHLVINGASDLLHELFGPDLGYHARSALGFAALPTGVAVEVEAIFEVV